MSAKDDSEIGQAAGVESVYVIVDWTSFVLADLYSSGHSTSR